MTVLVPKLVTTLKGYSRHQFFADAALSVCRLGRGDFRALVLIMRQVSAIDSTGLHALRDMVKRFQSGGTAVLVVGLHAQPMVALERAGLLDTLGRDNLVGTIDEALERARALAPRG